MIPIHFRHLELTQKRFTLRNSIWASNWRTARTVTNLQLMLKTQLFCSNSMCFLHVKLTLFDKFQFFSSRNTIKKWRLKRVEAVWRSLSSNIHITDQCCMETYRSIARSMLTNNQIANNFSLKFAASLSSLTFYRPTNQWKQLGQFAIIAQ